MSGIRELIDQALDLHRSGALSEARQLYLQALEEHPGHADILNLLGVLALQCRDFETALKYLKQAVDTGAKAEYHNNLGLAYKHLDDEDEARRQFETALEIEPDHLDATVNLASLAQDAGRFDEAFGLLDPLSREAAGHPQFLYNFAAVCLQIGAAGRAHELLEKLLAIIPGDADALFNYGMALKNLGDIASAGGVFEKLLGDAENAARAGWYLSQCRLLLEDFSRGWEYYPTRFRALGIPRPAIDLPSWDPDKTVERGLLIWAEQGVGDELLFATQIPRLSLDRRLIHYQCDARLRPLLERSYEGIRFLDRDKPLDAGALNIDYQCAAGDLIRHTNPALHPTSACPGCLRGDPDRAKALRLPGRRTGAINIGLSYNTGGSCAAARMPPPDLWRVFDEFAGEINLIDLQSNQSRRFSPPAALLGNRLLQQVDDLDLYDDLDGLAALISRLDHVVSIDNAVAHLAASLGIPVILLLSTVHDWRWPKKRDTPPWFPSMRIIRQPRAGDWNTVESGLVSQLRNLIRQRGR